MADAPRATRTNDRDIAGHAVLSMQALASYADQATNLALLNAAWEIAGPETSPQNSDVDGLRHLLDRHREEWHSFLLSLPPASWVRAMAGMN